MNNSASAIRSALASALGEVTQLQQVSLGKSTDMSGFPFCRFYLSSVTNELRDNAPSYWRKYNFTIEIWQELSNKSPQVAEQDLQDAIDAVLDKLGTEWTLNGNVDTSLVESGTIQEVETNVGPALVCSIPFSTRTLIA